MINGEPEHTGDIFCWCAPRIQQEGDTDIVIHRSLEQILAEAVNEARQWSALWKRVAKFQKQEALYYIGRYVNASTKLIRLSVNRKLNMVNRLLAELQAVRDVLNFDHHYPEGVFTPLTEDELLTAIDALSTSVRNGSDRLHADWARHLAKVARENYERVVKETRANEVGRTQDAEV